MWGIEIASVFELGIKIVFVFVRGVEVDIVLCVRAEYDFIFVYGSEWHDFSTGIEIGLVFVSMPKKACF